MKIYFTVLQSVYKKDNPIFLSQSLQSIAENTVQSYSVVLVKDGILNHELESVISEWQSKLPLKVVGYEKNQGLAYALNYGLQFVETELVARMDSDDICFSYRFEKQIAQFEVDSSIEILGVETKFWQEGLRRTIDYEFVKKVQGWEPRIRFNLFGKFLLTSP